MGHIIVCLSTFVQALDVFLSFMKMNWYGAAECCALHMGCFLCARMLLFHNSVGIFLNLGFVLNYLFEVFRFEVFFVL